ncbi:hypothetical protein [Kribbella sp. NPDC048915]|uniref:hypothetical protein n=1 Tax=Kribbella sp. NPDC048915 TaxID=3155148 RepID=UPI0033DD0132
MCDCCRRLLALLRLIEHGAVPCGVLGDDAVLDAWFGPRSPVFPAGAHPAAPVPVESHADGTRRPGTNGRGGPCTLRY